MDEVSARKVHVEEVAVGNRAVRDAPGDVLHDRRVVDERPASRAPGQRRHQPRQGHDHGQLGDAQLFQWLARGHESDAVRVRRRLVEQKDSHEGAHGNIGGSRELSHETGDRLGDDDESDLTAEFVVARRHTGRRPPGSAVDSDLDPVNARAQEQDELPPVGADLSGVDRVPARGVASHLEPLRRDAEHHSLLRRSDPIEAESAFLAGVGEQPGSGDASRRHLDPQGGLRSTHSLEGRGNVCRRARARKDGDSRPRPI